MLPSETKLMLDGVVSDLRPAYESGKGKALRELKFRMMRSVAIGEELKDQRMDEVRRPHFAQTRKLITQFYGHEIKTVGDSFMVAFRSVEKAFDFAQGLQMNTDHPQIQVRAGIHIGPMRVEEGDLFGDTVNFAARVAGVIKGAEIWLSGRAKEDIDSLGAEHHRTLKWERHDGIELKGFRGSSTLWSLV